MFKSWSQSETEWNASDAVCGEYLPTDAWQSVLQASFGATVLRLECGGRPLGAVTCFPAGPLSIGYLNFPSGLPLVSGPEPLTPPREMRASVSTMRPDLLRFQLPYDDSRFKTVQTNRTVIEDLQEWSAEDRTKSRRTRNKIYRGTVQIRPAARTEAGSLFSLYAGTVSRHDGKLRYTLKYFEELLRLSANDAGVHVLVACPAKNEKARIIAFIAFVVGKTRGYYLHGGHNKDYRQLYAADQLFLTMIRYARQAGAYNLDLLASPEDQTSLTRYKESWGGRTQSFFQYSVGCNKLLEWIVHTAQWFDSSFDGRLSMNR